MSSHLSPETGDKKPYDIHSEDSSHPGMNPDYAERGKQLGEENAYGSHSVGTGGHGKSGNSSSRQRVGGVHSTDALCFTEEQEHPGMNPDEAARGAELGHENAHGGHSIGTGGHGNSGHSSNQQRAGGEHSKGASCFTQEQLYPGINPNPAERGKQLDKENPQGGHSIGTGGHEQGVPKVDSQ
ncbi:unnamed protein product [Rotaria magnacalcarata]|uniref:Uncharacterized protein n=1 Tax=Rotaria magnacalcarata TaxID=392030 RepID=A0A815EUQ4_9BILA|nr:unnamed protein product [Rotaria magnacalcarata]CAF1670472.1 unnamed protein product [Rotaria magnacalcarata]CAF2191600.1 unnamed protein product [Rotaria magnacalcarata]CAF3843347.1 unnamed protein product [Rotaria magnacalcarata]CAF4070284.1 unnamed protein product [Rotaria magnacalcarata]